MAISQFRKELNKINVEFLSTDVDTALTFTRIAFAADPRSEHRARLTAKANIAYVAIVRLLPRVAFTRQEEQRFSKKLRLLKRALHALA